MTTMNRVADPAARDDAARRRRRVVYVDGPPCGRADCPAPRPGGGGGRPGRGHWLSKCTTKPAMASCVPMSAAARIRKAR